MSVQGGAKTGDRALMADPWSKLRKKRWLASDLSFHQPSGIFS
jgi:hypothetical protein